jgi:hypothetical protein
MEMLKLIFAYAASTLFAILFAAGLVFIMMPLSDPGAFEGPGDLRDMFALGGSFTLIGLGGTFGLRGFYRAHSTFSRLASVTTSLLAMTIGLICIAVTHDSHSSLPYLIVAYIFGFVIMTSGMVLTAIFLGLKAENGDPH